MGRKFFSWEIFICFSQITLTVPWGWLALNSNYESSVRIKVTVDCWKLYWDFDQSTIFENNCVIRMTLGCTIFWRGQMYWKITEQVGNRWDFRIELTEVHINTLRFLREAVIAIAVAIVLEGMPEKSYVFLSTVPLWLLMDKGQISVLMTGRIFLSHMKLDRFR